MVHKIRRNIDLLKEKLMTELKLDSKFIEKKIGKQFHKLPLDLQFLLSQPSMEVKQLRKYVPLPRIMPIGEEKVRKLKRRYGVFTIHDKRLYIGYVKTLPKDRAEVRLREVFP